MSATYIEMSASRLPEMAVKDWPIGAPTWICWVTDQPELLTSFATTGGQPPDSTPTPPSSSVTVPLTCIRSPAVRLPGDSPSSA